MEKETIYFDNAASTRMDDRVLLAMKPYLFDVYAVATSEFGYSLGIEAREALDDARENILSALGNPAGKLIFTSGSTESSNIAIKGVVKKLSGKKGNHIIVSKIEDFPVLNSAKSLEREGFRVTYLDVDKYGSVDISQLEDSIGKETILVSIQHANQEIGTIQDIKTIGEICKKNNILFHSDATHSFMRVPMDLRKLGVDLLTISAHTIHGPKGIGALFLREGVSIAKWIDGGFQEFDLRAGVENIPGAVGFAKAVELVTEEENERLEKLRDYLIEKVQNEIPYVTPNGHPEKRVPHNANITFHYVEGESITLHLDMKGFSVSTGSACFSKSLEASHVILGIGGDHERAHGSVRFTLGRFNKKEDVDGIVKALKEIVSQLRAISPLKGEKVR
ncbi:MAG: cysteine desulfurase family protein [candidate division WOR-3 bacterium]|jgi:cysteine desulfurase